MHDMPAQTAPASLGERVQALGAHALTAAAVEQLQRNLQREDQLIFTLLHTFWEVRACTCRLSGRSADALHALVRLCHLMHVSRSACMHALAQ